ncbi:hypothetical protein SAMN04489727_2157 [Amycolatopsis tolypomycina]|uniref:Uncharacterized protein n=1 Tax=Amycolatopsis tolypomycina TaxID=208445 RepID=A0A1H4JTP7_9PSEU|nr:hypothetical protein [Amycolatopsis tolypomycina]SEB48620.1 hypothetical protein SAMN04489727_2120 [Amycolatopsis tolypomycina]SEB49158.1 hypothetical protein SAMN04489727_2157 [Amycolatopsis tolypomycina]
MTTTHPVAAHPTFTVLAEVAAERTRQDTQWGEQNHPDGTGPDVALTGLSRRAADAAHTARFATELARAEGRLTWLHILREEVYEGLADDDPAALRAELVQIAATAVCWIEAIDRRAGKVTA